MTATQEGTQIYVTDQQNKILHGEHPLARIKNNPSGSNNNITNYELTKQIHVKQYNFISFKKVEGVIELDTEVWPFLTGQLRMTQQFPLPGQSPKIVYYKEIPNEEYEELSAIAKNQATDVDEKQSLDIILGNFISQE